MNWRALTSADEVAAAIGALYAERGSAHYEESVTQTSHAVQAAALARAAAASDALVVAALLHDVGHLLEPDDRELIRARDLHHEHLGARFLAAWFGPEVIEPIRGHVAAKRYLCAIEPGYHDALSPASARSLALQGGPMSAVETAEFERRPVCSSAAQLRRWDDLAKRTDLTGAAFDDQLDLVARLVRPCSA